MRRFFATRFLVGAASLLVGSNVVLGTTRNVTNLNDSGPGSLRDAIAISASGDTINFAVTGTIIVISELVVNKSLTISGPGETSLTVQRSLANPNTFFRVFNFTTGTSVLSSLTITKGDSTREGGGILNSGTLTVQFCTITENRSHGTAPDASTGSGGGVANFGNLTINYCTITNNSAANTLTGHGAAGSGGGIWNDGTLSVNNSTISNNTAGRSGGGVQNYGQSNASATLIGCTIRANDATAGGGIDCASDRIVDDGISPHATLVVRGCTVADNTADFGGAIACDAGTGVPNGVNGVISATAENSSLVNNTADNTGAIRVTGGGTTNFTIKSCTFSGNIATTGEASGVYCQNSGNTVTIGNNIFKKGSSGPNILKVGGGTITSLGYNLADDGGGASFFGTGDQVNTDPRLDPAGLQYNGGFTQTIALVYLSPAIDKGKSLGLTTDQRGFARPIDNTGVVSAPGGDQSDIGAYESPADPMQSGFPSLYVLTTADHDDGTCGGSDCTLREAINLANARPGNQTIQFETNVSGTITLDRNLGQLNITDPLIIVGRGARILAISGGGYVRVLSNSSTTTISGLTIRDGWNVFGGTAGDTKQGGGIFNSGNLTVNDCAFTGNYVRGGDGATGAINGGNGQGGAIYNGAVLILNRCLFYRSNSGNLAVGGNAASNVTPLGRGGNGGAGQGGAVFNAAGASLGATNCTFHENSANGGAGGNGGAFGGSGGAGAGGGIYSLNDLNVTACTIVANNGTGGLAGSGGSPENDGKGGTGKGGIVVAGPNGITNTIVAGNTGGGGLSYDVDGAFGSFGYNLIGTANHSSGFTGTGDQAGTDAAPINPQLAALQNNGGPTDTLALLSNSPARDKGKVYFSLTVDQRGFPRPLDDPGITNASGGDGTDIGAFEADAPQMAAALIVTTNQDHDDGLCGYNDCSLREAINAANALAGDNTITFAPAVTNTGIILLGSALPNVTTNVNIQGPGARIFQVHGNNLYRVFSFTGGTSSVSSLTVTNGRVAGSAGGSASGGGIFNQGTLTLFQCAIKNCSAAGAFNFTGTGGNGNGGGVFNSGTLSMDSCTGSGNSATGGGGGFGGRENAGLRGGSANGGGVCNSGGTLTLTNCTVSGNSALGGKGGNSGNPAGDGGNGYAGVYNTGTLTMTACTVSGNSGTGGAGGTGTTNGATGAAIGGVRGGGVFTMLRNTISAANTSGDVTGAFTSQGYNLIGPLGTATGFAAIGDQTGVTNPVLGLLQNNGGPTDTMALLLSPTTSPAIDRGNSFALPLDQRGHFRIANGSIPNASGGDGTDIGAFEFHPLTGADNDGDGMSNDFETFYGFNPGNPSDGPLDSDGDGLTNAQEYQAGTNPRDPNSNLRVIAVAKNGDDFSITFSLAVAGKKYRLTRKDALTDSFWGSINGVADFAPTLSGSGQITDSNGASVTKRAYRVEVVPQF